MSAKQQEVQRVRSQSYFDRYPERKGSGPLVASSKLVKSAHVTAGTPVTSSPTTAHGTSNMFDSTMETQDVGSSYRARGPGSSQPSEERVTSFTDRLCRENNKLHAPPSQHNHSAPPHPESSHAGTQAKEALERYKARTTAAIAARLPLGYPPANEVAPKKRYRQRIAFDQYAPTAPQVTVTSHADERAASEWTGPHQQTHDHAPSSRRLTISSSGSVPSIDDIIRKHSPTSQRRITSSRLSYIGLTEATKSSLERSDIADHNESSSSGRSSLDSIGTELQNTLRACSPTPERSAQASSSPALQAVFNSGNTGTRKPGIYSFAMTPSLSAPMLLHKKSSPTLLPSSRMSGLPPDLIPPTPTGTNATQPVEGRRRKTRPNLPNLSAMSRSKSTANLKSTPGSHVGNPPGLPTPSLPPVPQIGTISAATPDSLSDGSKEALSVSRFVHSSKLTKLITLKRPLYAGSVVSVADVGDSEGHAVFLFLGLGAVRHLAGLYDEMASALGLRLICIDRWGMGRTDDLPAERRGVLEWSEVVSEIADAFGIDKFSFLAHSAGAPYAMGASLALGHRLAGPVHLLAPWVSAAVENGYKWLRYVPDGIIRTAQAAEWRMQGWKLGASSLSPDASVSSARAATPGPNGGSDTRGWTTGRKNTISSNPTIDPNQSDSCILHSFDSSIAATLTPDNSLYSSPSPSPTTSAGSRLMRDGVSTEAPQSHWLRSRVSNSLEQRLDRTVNGEPSRDQKGGQGSGCSTSLLAEDYELIDAWHASVGPDANTSREQDAPPVPPKTPVKVGGTAKALPSPSASSSTARRHSLSPAVDLSTELLRASHAESSGSASDLLVILGRSSQRPWGFSYIDVPHPVLVWHGEKDERVSVSSVLWMEREMENCKVNIVKNANHSLMTNVGVVVEALESIVASRF